MAEAGSNLSAAASIRESEHSSWETPLQQAGRACQRAIEACEAVERLMHQQWGRHRLIDFNRWAASVGLFADRRNALDYRLAQYPDVSRVLLSVMNTLTDIAIRLSNGVFAPAIATGHSDVGTEEPAQDDTSALSLSPWSSDQDSTRSSTTGGPTDPTMSLDSNLTEACKDLESLLDRLLEIGILIRRSGETSRLFKADATFKEESYAHLQEHLDFQLRLANVRCVTSEEGQQWNGYEPAESNVQQWFQSMLRPDQVRLITANLKRRHRFAYARKRATTLATSRPIPKVDLAPAAPIATPQSQSKNVDNVQIGESTAVPTQFSASVVEEGALRVPVDVAESNIIYPDRSTTASTDVVLMSDKLRYPNAPRISTKRAFKCPCCSQILPKRTGTNHKAWRKHIAHDLYPYTCPASECTAGPNLFVKQKEWKRHLETSHKTASHWTCSVCSDSKPYYERASFEDHIRAKHSSTVKGKHVDAMVRSCQREVIDLPPSCPVCGVPRDFESTTTFINHLGACIHSFSLLSLPWNDAKHDGVSHVDAQTVQSILQWRADVQLDPSAPSGSTAVHQSQLGESNADITEDQSSEPVSSLPDEFYFDPEGDISSGSRVSRQDISLLSSKGSRDISSTAPNLRDSGMNVTDDEISSTKDIYIAVAGDAGAGKSTFINLCTGGDIPVSDRLSLSADRIEERSFALDNNRRLHLIELPHIGPGLLYEPRLLRETVTWLVKMYLEGKRLMGIVYLHDIQNTRAPGGKFPGLSLLQTLCGTQFFSNIVLATSRWPNRDQNICKAQEEELFDPNGFLGDMTRHGSIRARLEQQTSESALAIVDPIILRCHPRTLQIQEEMVQWDLLFHATQAGLKLRHLLDEYEEDCQHRLKRHRRSALSDQQRTDHAYHAFEARRLVEIVRRLESYREGTDADYTNLFNLSVEQIRGSLSPEVMHGMDTDLGGADSFEAQRNWADDVDDPWWPCILSMDGGGVRGYSTLLILKHLMNEIAELEAQYGNFPSEQKFLPCHYFDCMFGAGSGGLIAILLGRLRMTVEEALDAYKELMRAMFSSPKIRPWSTPKYRHQPFERAMRKLVMNRHSNFDGDARFKWKEPADSNFAGSGWVQSEYDQLRVCQVCCLTITHDSKNSIYRFCTYQYGDIAARPTFPVGYDDGARGIPIWQVARATTATPSYFGAAKADMSGIEREFMDSTAVVNNPSEVALGEFHSLFEGIASEPALLLSIGVGLPEQELLLPAGTRGSTSRFPAIFKASQKAYSIADLLSRSKMDEDIHHRLRHLAGGEDTWYRRFNVDIGVFDVAFDNLQSFDQMAELTEIYRLRSLDVRKKLGQTARKLVMQRRAREAAGGGRWEGFVGHGKTDMRASGAPAGESALHASMNDIRKPYKAAWPEIPGEPLRRKLGDADMRPLSARGRTLPPPKVDPPTPKRSGRSENVSKMPPQQPLDTSAAPPARQRTLTLPKVDPPPRERLRRPEDIA